MCHGHHFYPLLLLEPELADPHRRGRPRKETVPKPSAPFERDPVKGAAGAFDRLTGERVPQGRLKTYADALRAYHLSCESKFENGEAWDAGETRRRLVVAERVELVGKEAHRVGRHGSEKADEFLTSRL